MFGDHFHPVNTGRKAREIHRILIDLPGMKYTLPGIIINRSLQNVLWSLDTQDIYNGIWINRNCSPLMKNKNFSNV